MITLNIYKDEVGVRIDFRCDNDEFDYYDYITTNADLKVWDNDVESISFVHGMVFKIMSVIDDQFLHEQLMERKEKMNGNT